MLMPITFSLLEIMFLSTTLLLIGGICGFFYSLSYILDINVRERKQTLKERERRNKKKEKEPTGESKVIHMDKIQVDR